MADLKLIQLTDIGVAAGEVCGPDGCGPDAGDTAGTACACGGGACGCGGHAGAAHEHGAAALGGLEAPVITTYRVDGMSCGHCVQSVTREVAKLAGVDAIDIRLVPDGVSLVTVESLAPLDAEAVRAAVEEAGYELA